LQIKYDWILTLVDQFIICCPENGWTLVVCQNRSFELCVNKTLDYHKYVRSGLVWANHQF